jgi:hypothetical protein
MKCVILILLAGSLPADSIEGTVWYDSKGKVAWVDGPAAEKKAAEPFVPQWIAREERRDRALRGGYRPHGRASSGWPAWGYWSGVRPYDRSVATPLPCRAFPSSFRITRPSGGLRVIIR